MTTGITEWAPIALFVYKRPEHVRRTITSLKACLGYADSPIYVFADGPKAEAEIQAVQATRAAVRELLGPRAVVLEQDQNRGLANSVIMGVTELCERHGRVLVVEDDLVLAPSFLQFLNEGLERYGDEPRAMQVSGHMFDVPSLVVRHEALFLPIISSWGWATWMRAWKLFDPSATGWRERLSDEAEAKRFNLGGRYDYFGMLKRQMGGEIDSWAIRWYYTVFAHDGLVLFPPRTLVTNIGLDGSGTHGRLALPAHQGPLGTRASFDLPTDVVESRQKAQVFDAISAFRPRSARRILLALMKVGLRRLGFK